MNKKQAREILKATHYGDKDESIKLIDEAIDYLLELHEIVYCKDCQYSIRYESTYENGKLKCLFLGLKDMYQDSFCSFGDKRK